MNTIQKLKLRLALMLAMAVGQVSAGSVVLPIFNTADKLAGRKLTVLDNFVQTTANFSIDAKAKAGVPIELKFGGISYVPKADGVVRLVQKDSKVYVFENDAYATTIIPNYIYTTQEGNIVRNGSFETVTDNLGDGRWKAAEWETWNGGTPAWGGDVGYVNVRENAKYCSDGTKSIILHTNSHWLCQELTAGSIEANGIYQLSCDYWTSEGAGNGNAAYRLQLGSSLAGNDLLDMEAYTTLEGDYTKQSFSTLFQVGENIPSQMFMSFYRSLPSKVDWLDNVILLKANVADKGFTGSDSVVYAMGAFAPQNMTVPEGADMTSVCINPDFADGTMTDGAPAGWTLDAKVTQSKISTIEKGNGTISGNQNHWQIWHSGSALTGRAYQLMTNIPNGRYTITADVCTAGFGGSINLYANNGKTAINSGAAAKYTVSGMAVDGTLEIGLSFATTGGTTIDFDNFTVLYHGMDAEGFREVLQIKIAESESVLASLAEGYDGTDINNSTVAAKALTEDATADEVIAAITAINKALEGYQTFLDQKAAEQKAIDDFAKLIADAQNERDTEDYPGTTDFDEAISNAKTFLAQLEADPYMSTTKATDELNAARETYYNSQYTIAAISQKVSEVDLTLNGSEKYVLRIDGKPFYPTAIQVRGDKLRGYIGWSESEIEAAFKRAADDGFNMLSVPVFWSEVEPEKNHFDWHLLDRYLGWCKKYGVKMEILWFSWSSGGRIQYLTNYNGKQQLRTPDYICSLDGKSEYNMLRTEWEYSLDWRDKELMARETYVLGKIMDHVSLWDANNGNPHTVVGVQLGNEARAHGNNSATSAEIINYYHHVGAAVKNSKYSTWTRLNCVSNETSGRTSANESKRNNGGTNIDFVGIDIYGTNASKVKGNMDGQLGTNGKNFRMIMEIDAKDANSPIYQMAALAGDKAFDYYNLGPVDGNGLYTNNGNVLAERSHISLVRQRNKMLNLANQDIALRKQGSGLYVYNYAGNSTSSETGLASISFTPNAANTQAVAVAHSSSEIALLATNAGSFTIPSSLNVTSAQTGYFDKYNRWVKEGDATYADNVVKMTSTGCVLLTMDGKEEENSNLVVNGEFNNDTYGWINTTKPWTYKVSTAAKGDGSVIKAGEGHMQIWDGGAVTGKVYQDITLPNGEYTLTSGCYATFKGSVSMYANNEKVDIISGKSAYYTVVVNVTDEKLQIGLDINTTGETDIEWDHVVLVEATTTNPVTGTLTLIAKDNDIYYATFSSDKDVLFPVADVEVDAVSVTGNTMHITDMVSTKGTYNVKTDVEGSSASVGNLYYVPANTGVLIQSQTNSVTYYYPYSSETVTITETNQLKPAPADGDITHETGHVYYKLAYNDFNTKTGLGFYWGAAGGGAFSVKANTAYLDVTATGETPAKGFSFDGTTTGISSVATEGNAKEIYNIAGQKVNTMSKPGMYIVNGKKIVIRK